MSKSRILILHSFKDGGYEERLQRISTNPNLDAITFHHCCVIDRDRESARSRELDRVMDVDARDPQFKEWLRRRNELLGEIVKKEVGPLLHEQIATFNPEIVIIHGGTVFDAVPGPFLTMIIDLMEQHPGLPFALEGKEDWLIRRAGMNYDLFEQRWAVNQMRWVKHNFVDDPEVEGIIKAIFE